MSNPSPEILKTARVETAKVAAQAEKPDVAQFVPENPENFEESFWYKAQHASVDELLPMLRDVDAFTFQEGAEDGSAPETWTGAKMADVVRRFLKGEATINNVPAEFQDIVLRLQPKHEPLDADLTTGDAVFLNEEGARVSYTGEPAPKEKRGLFGKKTKTTLPPVPAKAPLGQQLPKQSAADKDLVFTDDSNTALLDAVGDATKENPAVVLADGADEKFKQASADTWKHHPILNDTAVSGDAGDAKFAAGADDAFAAAAEDMPEGGKFAEPAPSVPESVIIPIEGEPSVAENIPVHTVEDDGIERVAGIPIYETPELNATKEALETAREAYIKEYRSHSEQTQGKGLLSRIKQKITGTKRNDPPIELPESLLAAKALYNTAMQAYGHEMIAEHARSNEKSPAEIEKLAKARVFRDIFLSEYKLRQEAQADTLPPVEKNLFVKTADWWAKRGLVTKIAVTSALVGFGGAVGAGVAAGLSGMSFAALGGGLFEKVSKIEKLDALRNKNLDEAWGSLVDQNPEAGDMFANIEKQARAIMSADDARRRTRELKRTAVMIASGIVGVATMQGITSAFSSFSGGEVAGASGTAPEAVSGTAGAEAVVGNEYARPMQFSVIDDPMVAEAPVVTEASVVAPEIEAPEVAENIPQPVEAPASPDMNPDSDIHVPLEVTGAEPTPIPIAEPVPVAEPIPVATEIPVAEVVVPGPEVVAEPVSEAVTTETGTATVEASTTGGVEAVADGAVEGTATGAVLEGGALNLENVTGDHAAWFGSLHESPYNPGSLLDQAKMTIVQKLSGAGIMGMMDGMPVPSPLVDRAIDGVFGSGNAEGWKIAADIISRPDILEQIKTLQAEAMADPSKTAMIEAQIRALFPRS
jgi:hypothetical protein